MKAKNNSFVLGAKIVLTAVLVLSSCKSNKDEAATKSKVASEAVEKKVNKGIGPISSVVLGELDLKMAKQGKELFGAKCGACHKFAEKYVGPALAGVTKRRAPEWIMNMMLNPTEMTSKDPIAKELLATHLTQMTFQDISKEDARNILEFFRLTDEKEKS